jgi:hypothetical protein
VTARSVVLAHTVTASSRPIAGAVLAVIGAVLIVAGFFLPWFEGDGMFALRTFSGSGLARDLHTLTASMETVMGGALTPLLFYIVPAGAVGVALYSVLAGMSAVTRLLTLVLAVYTLAVAFVALVLATTAVTDADRYLGAPSWGLGVTMLGAALMLAGGIRRGERDEGA